MNEFINIILVGITGGLIACVFNWIAFAIFVAGKMGKEEDNEMRM
jgi:hypothetical protein